MKKKKEEKKSNLERKLVKIEEKAEELQLEREYLILNLELKGGRS